MSENLWVCPSCDNVRKGDRNSGCEYCKIFLCRGCRAWHPWSQGAADNRPGLCDGCWADREKRMKNKVRIVFDFSSAGMKNLRDLPVGAFFVRGSIGNSPHVYQMIEKNVDERRPAVVGTACSKHLVMCQTTGEEQTWEDANKTCYAQIEVTLTVHGYTDTRVREPFGDEDGK